MTGDDVVGAVRQLLAGAPAFGHAGDVYDQREGVAGANVGPVVRRVAGQPGRPSQEVRIMPPFCFSPRSTRGANSMDERKPLRMLDCSSSF